MADQRDEMLREMARHRGFRLVKSRRRKPGGDFGHYGLTDLKTGQDCFGIGPDGFEASADEIESYLRQGAKADWKRSLGAGGKAAKRARPPAGPKPPPKPPPTHHAPKAEPEPEPEAQAERERETELVVRAATASDSEAIAALLAAPVADVQAALRQLVRAGEAPLVAEESELLGCAAYHLVPMLQHRTVGRLTLLLVAGDARRRGIGTALLEAVEARLRERGCDLVEAVSDIDLANAHGFFRRRGYERTSYRFAKPANQ